MKKKAKIILWVLRLIFYLAVAIYMFFSIYTGLTYVRLQISWLWLYLVILLIWSVLNLRKLVFQMSTKSLTVKDLKPNNKLINSIIVIYSLKFLVFIGISAIAFPLPDGFLKNYDKLSG